MRALWACVCHVRRYPDFFCAIVALHPTFIVFLGHAASPCSLKVRGLYLRLHREPLYRRIRLVHGHWHPPPEVRLLMLLSEIKRPTSAKHQVLF